MKLITTSFLSLVLLTFSLSAHADPVKRSDQTIRSDKATKTCRLLSGGAMEWDSLPWGEGGKTFKTTCKSCHTRKNENATFLWAGAKTQKAWNRVFETRYPKCAQDGSWNSIGDEQLRKVHDYLWRWASDNIEHLYRGG